MADTMRSTVTSCHGGDLQLVRRPQVGDLVNGVNPFVNQRLTLPPQRHRQLGAARWQLDQTVAVVDSNRQFISLKASVVRQLQ